MRMLLFQHNGKKNVCVPFCNNLSVPLQIYCCNHYDYDAFLTLKYLFELLDLTKMYKNQSINYGIFNIFFFIGCISTPKRLRR